MVLFVRILNLGLGSLGDLESSGFEGFLDFGGIKLDIWFPSGSRSKVWTTFQYMEGSCQRDDYQAMLGSLNLKFPIFKIIGPKDRLRTNQAGRLRACYPGGRGRWALKEQRCGWNVSRYQRTKLAKEEKLRLCLVPSNPILDMNLFVNTTTHCRMGERPGIQNSKFNG